jgi:hypothetical protein
MPGGSFGRSVTQTVILKTSKPFEQKKVVKACQEAAHKKAHGKSYYEIAEGDFRTLFMPSDRVIILSSQPAGDLDALFASDGTTPSVSADAAALIREVNQATVWAVMPFEGKTRTAIDEGLSKDPPPPELKPLGDALAKGKGVAVWGSLDGDEVKIGVNLACADAASASSVVRLAEDGWKKVLKDPDIAKLELTGLLAAPKIVKAWGEVKKGIKFTSDGATARVSLGMRRATVTDAYKEGEALANGKAGGILGAFGGGGKK